MNLQYLLKKTQNRVETFKNILISSEQYYCFALAAACAQALLSPSSTILLIVNHRTSTRLTSPLPPRSIFRHFPHLLYFLPFSLSSSLLLSYSTSRSLIPSSYGPVPSSFLFLLLSSPPPPPRFHSPFLPLFSSLALFLLPFLLSPPPVSLPFCPLSFSQLFT